MVVHGAHSLACPRPPLAQHVNDDVLHVCGVGYCRPATANYHVLHVCALRVHRSAGRGVVWLQNVLLGLSDNE